MLQGFPIFADEFDALRDEYQQKHNGFLIDLAGNAFPATVVASIVMALMFSFEWVQEDGHAAASSRADCLAAVRLMKRSRQS